MATWRFEIALLVLKNILLASPLTCEIFFNTQREISYLNVTLYYPLLPSPFDFSFPSFPLFSCSLSSSSYLFTPSRFLIYLSCPLYVHPLLYFLTLELLLSIFFPLFLLLVLFVLPLHTPCVLSSTFPAPITSTLSLLPSPFPPFPFNFSFPIFFLFFLPPDPFLSTPYTPLVLFSTFPAPYTSTPPLITSPFNFSFPSFPLFSSLLVLIFLPLHLPPLFFSHLPFLPPHTSPSSFPYCSSRAFQMFD